MKKIIARKPSTLSQTTVASRAETTDIDSKLHLVFCTTSNKIIPYGATQECDLKQQLPEKNQS